MIVVAIIGILAAVAIPGFMQYIKSSKTAEAKENLKAIGDGALSFYQAEHYADKGMTATTKQYPGVDQSTKVGEEATSDTVGKKFSPTAASVTSVLANNPWQALKFSISKPFYYCYSYAAESTYVAAVTCTPEQAAAGCKESEAVDNDVKAPSYFQANATASLSSAADSVFCINGGADGVLSNIYEGDSSTCKPNEAVAQTPN